MADSGHDSRQVLHRMHCAGSIRCCLWYEGSWSIELNERMNNAMSEISSNARQAQSFFDPGLSCAAAGRHAGMCPCRASVFYSLTAEPTFFPGVKRAGAEIQPLTE